MTFVESDPRALALIERNLQHCAVSDRYAIIRARFADAARRLQPGSFELIFLDPPYAPDVIVSSLEAAAPLVAPGGVLILEHARRDAAPASVASLAKTRDIISGDSALSLYQTDGSSGQALASEASQRRRGWTELPDFKNGVTERTEASEKTYIGFLRFLR